MGGGQETREALENIEAFCTKVIVEEAAQWKIDREAEVKDTGECLDARWNTGFFEECVQGAYEGNGLCGQLLLKLRTFVAEMLKYCLHSGANVEQRLASAGMNTESGDDFVKNQGRARVLSDLTNLAEEFARLEVRMTALDRLDENGREFTGMSANPFQ